LVENAIPLLLPLSLTYIYGSSSLRKFLFSLLKSPFISTMDKITSVIAALKAGKQPSQSQTNAWIEKLLQSELIQVEQTPGGGELSKNGKKLARDLCGVLEAYKGYGAHKNGMVPSSQSVSTPKASHR
jgi:hypothetical protein